MSPIPNPTHPPPPPTETTEHRSGELLFLCAWTIGRGGWRTRRGIARPFPLREHKERSHVPCRFRSPYSGGELPTGHASLPRRVLPGGRWRRAHGVKVLWWRLPSRCRRWTDAAGTTAIGAHREARGGPPRRRGRQRKASRTRPVSLRATRRATQVPVLLGPSASGHRHLLRWQGVRMLDRRGYAVVEIDCTIVGLPSGILLI
jgi:hypothetical protein